MTGACTIDGIDIATLGVLILRGGDHGFIQFPARKAPQLIEWPDLDGFEIGSDAPVYEARKLTVDYYLKGVGIEFQNRLNAFVSLHEAAGLRTVYLREFGQSFQLRYTGVSAFSLNRGFTAAGEKAARISMDYVADSPIDFIDTEAVASAYRAIPTQVELDGVDLAAFGIVVQDVYSTAMQRQLKERLLYSSKYSSGNVADTSWAAPRGKQEIAIRCTMICNNRAEFMQNWSALFNHLNKADLELNLAAPDKQYFCYYSSMDGFEKWPFTGQARAEFTLKLIGFEI